MSFVRIPEGFFNPSQSLVIASGQTQSGALSCGGCTLSAIEVPASFTGTAISFLVSSTLAGTYSPLYDTTNTIISVTVQAGRAYALDPLLFQGVQFVKIVSNATEGADRTLILSLKGYLLNSSAATAAVAAWVEQSKLIGTPSSSIDHQGQSVALSDDGNTLAIGAYGANSNTGVVFVFTRSGTTWVQQQAITSPVLTTGALFGLSVALSADGNTLIAGQPNTSAARSYIFIRTAGVWSSQATLFVGLNAHFGQSVSLSADGNRAAVGAPGNFASPGRGIVRIFNRSGSSWNIQATLTPSDSTDAQTGHSNTISLSADGTTIAISGPNDNSGQGAFWIWTFDGAFTWTQSAKITPPVTCQNGGFGTSISMSKDGLTVAVGSPEDNDPDFNLVGGTDIYSISGGVATQVAYLQGTGTSLPIDQVGQGTSVSLNGNGTVLAVGGPFDGNGIGAVWMFALVLGTWTQKQKLVPSDYSGPGPGIGQSVTLNYAGDTLATGGVGDTQGGSGTGATWVYINE